MKILVTGGKGFIGSKLVEILSVNHHVIIIDNEDMYDLVNEEEKQKLYEYRTRNWNNKNISFIKGDILNKDICLRSFTHLPDLVIHLAAYPTAKTVNDNPMDGVPKLVSGTTNLLWHSIKFNIKKFVYVSSSMVYGDFIDGTKENSITKPKNIYGESKLMGERLTKLFSKNENLKYVIVRPSGVYGPGDLPNRVVPKFFNNAMNNKTITVHDGKNKVDFTFLDNMVNGLIDVALSDIENESFNITNGNANSLETLANSIIKITKSKSKIYDVGSHKLYPMRGTLDISKAKKLINYNPKVNFETGLKEYYEWIKQY